jgi:hypothetical protein
VTRRVGRAAPHALLAGLLVQGVVGCQVQELRLFEPPSDPVVIVPVDIPAVSPAPLPPAAPDAGAPLPVAPPNLQPDCEPGSAACRNCIAARSCAAPSVCHPVSGACATPCPDETSQCPAPASLCHPDYRVCVWCLEDSNCGGRTPACNAAAGVCVECLADPHCALLGDAQRQRCNVSAQSCRQCIGSGDCLLGERCELPEGHCEDSEANDD